MPKPICLLTFGRSVRFDKINFTNIQKLLPGYNALISRDDNQVETVSVKVYWHKDYTDAQYEELKKIVEESLLAAK
jgi:hypothetical protein